VNKLRGTLLEQWMNIFIERQSVPITNFKNKNHKINSLV